VLYGNDKGDNKQTGVKTRSTSENDSSGLMDCMTRGCCACGGLEDVRDDEPVAAIPVPAAAATAVTTTNVEGVDLESEEPSPPTKHVWLRKPRVRMIGKNKRKDFF